MNTVETNWFDVIFQLVNLGLLVAVAILIYKLYRRKFPKNKR